MNAARTVARSENRDVPTVRCSIVEKRTLKNCLSTTSRTVALHIYAIRRRLAVHRLYIVSCVFFACNMANKPSVNIVISAPHESAVITSSRTLIIYCPRKKKMYLLI